MKLAISGWRADVRFREKFPLFFFSPKDPQTVSFKRQWRKILDIGIFTFTIVLSQSEYIHRIITAVLIGCMTYIHKALNNSVKKVLLFKSAECAPCVNIKNKQRM